MLDNFKRYQQGFKLEELFPAREDGFCACGCGTVLKGKQKKWASEKCSDRAYLTFSILKGNNGMIRKYLYSMDKGFCRNCGVFDEHWEADHIIPVFLGGGLCTIENLQTLCYDCHKEKSKFQLEFQRNAISSQAASTANMILL